MLTDPVQIFAQSKQPIDPYNGLTVNNKYIPLELLNLILANLDEKDLLNASLVCKRWFSVVRSTPIWIQKYKKRFNRNPSLYLPWYVYYAYFYHNQLDRNILRNGNGQHESAFWQHVHTGGEGFVVECKPQDVFPLPPKVEEFEGNRSCFACCQGICLKIQEVHLSPLMRYVLDRHRPCIYVSEWATCTRLGDNLYTLAVSLHGEKYKGFPTSVEEDVANPALLCHYKSLSAFDYSTVGVWSKLNIVLTDYPSGVKTIVFHHTGINEGSKMAGGVIKILFDTLNTNILYDNEIIVRERQIHYDPHVLHSQQVMKSNISQVSGVVTSDLNLYEHNVSNKTERNVRYQMDKDNEIENYEDNAQNQGDVQLLHTRKIHDDNHKQISGGNMHLKQVNRNIVTSSPEYTIIADFRCQLEHIRMANNTVNEVEVPPANNSNDSVEEEVEEEEFELSEYELSD